MTLLKVWRQRRTKHGISVLAKQIVLRKRHYTPTGHDPVLVTIGEYAWVDEAPDARDFKTASDWVQENRVGIIQYRRTTT